MSFCSETEVFLGSVILKAGSIEDAITATHKEGINPGGQIMVCEVPEGLTEMPPIPPTMFNKLLSRAELETFWPSRTTGELKAEGLDPEEVVTAICCNDCNVEVAR